MNIFKHKSLYLQINFDQNQFFPPQKNQMCFSRATQQGSGEGWK
jgi:hypothetical protein